MPARHGLDCGEQVIWLGPEPLLSTAPASCTNLCGSVGLFVLFSWASPVFPPAAIVEFLMVVTLFWRK